MKPLTGIHRGLASSAAVLGPSLLLLSCGAALVGECRAEPERRPPTVEAQRVAEPVVVDGRLEERVWAEARAFPLAAMMADGRRLPLHEKGTARFAWDDRFFYIALDFTDTDVVAEGEANGLDQIRLGDVGEVFLKPADRPWYFELHVTPRGCQTSYFFPSSGRRLPGCKLTVHRLTAAAQVEGTLNDPRDRDRGWTAEMAVPLEMLAERGCRFGPETAWKVLVGRYNFSVALDSTELSTMPEISQVNFHLTGEFATLRLAPAAR